MVEEWPSIRRRAIYQHGSQKYRDSVDRIKFWVGLIMVVLVVLIFILAALVEGPDAAIKMLR